MLMTVSVVVRVLMMAVTRLFLNPRISLEFLNAASMQDSGVKASGLLTSMRQLFDDGFQILCCAFGRTRQR